MTTFEYLTAIGSVGVVMDKNHIPPKLTRYAPMYEDWERLKAEGHKKTWIIAYLCDSYDISRSTFHNIINKMGENVVI